ncbi:MAG: hypothetical protein EXR70_05335 [Deltaproteobacteria bacterium]|nr:hypothetical protein [Deltaproteobacteria bacterium]
MKLSLLFYLFLAAIAYRVVMHLLDKQRIKDEVETQLGRVVSITWNPFGRGWFLSRTSAITRLPISTTRARR